MPKYPSGSAVSLQPPTAKQGLGGPHRQRSCSHHLQGRVDDAHVEVLCRHHVIGARVHLQQVARRCCSYVMLCTLSKQTGMRCSHAVCSHACQRSTYKPQAMQPTPSRSLSCLHASRVLEAPRLVSCRVLGRVQRAQHVLTHPAGVYTRWQACRQAAGGSSGTALLILLGACRCQATCSRRISMLGGSIQPPGAGMESSCCQ